MENIMNIRQQFIATMLLTGAAALLSPTTHAAYDAYEELSGTHASAKQYVDTGMLGPASKTKQSFFDVNQPYADFMETPIVTLSQQSGAQGRIGYEGQLGAAGKTNSESSLFNLSGDLADGCSKFLRCSGG
jgi:hypothetical protein